MTSVTFKGPDTGEVATLSVEEAIKTFESIGEVHPSAWSMTARMFARLVNAGVTLANAVEGTTPRALELEASLARNMNWKGPSLRRKREREKLAATEARAEALGKELFETHTDLNNLRLRVLRYSKLLPKRSNAIVDLIAIARASVGYLRERDTEIAAHLANALDAVQAAQDETDVALTGVEA